VIFSQADENTSAIGEALGSPGAPFAGNIGKWPGVVMVKIDSVCAEIWRSSSGTALPFMVP